jgi:hypothetical protein
MITPDTITDEQIRALRAAAYDPAISALCKVALQELGPCRACTARSERGLEGACPTCANERTQARMHLARILNEREAEIGRPKTIPMRIGASIPVAAIRDAYQDTYGVAAARLSIVPARQIHAEREKRQAEARELARNAALLVGRGAFMPGAISDEQILAIATGAATLRGWSDTGVTYHDQKCAACGGDGFRAERRLQHEACATCRGDGFAPPVAPLVASTLTTKETP